MGEVRVSADKYWGAQTQRSINNFKIGKYKMPIEIIRAYAYLKKAAANANCELGTIEDAKRKIISDVCDEILAGKLDDNFKRGYQMGQYYRLHSLACLHHKKRMYHLCD